jgi:crotonobetainyl-CoA:carnitine CoA-transferase CaiB-like acyl-CoA transferase
MSGLNQFLNGVKVLDLSQYLPGPMASLVLADMGAGVLKIEPPAGDEMQRLGPRDAQGTPVFYAAVNAGKAARRMDLKNPQEREAFIALAQDADVLIEGFRPGVMDRLGISWSVLHAANPGLIFCSINGFGENSPLSAVAGHDGNYLAMAGVLHRNGAKFFDPPIADTSGALYAAVAILGALHARHASGQGCRIDLALADVAMPLQLFQVADYGANGTVPVSRETYLNGGAAYYNVYETADGRHVMLGSVEPKFWTAFCRAADRADWIARHAEPMPQHELQRDVQAYIGTLTLQQCLDRFGGTECMVSPVLDLGEALQTDHVRARGLVERAPDGSLQALFPALVDGETPSPRSPLRQG